MGVIVHVEFQHTSDQQLGLHDPVTDQPKVAVLFRRLDGPVKGAVHNADQVSDAHRLILDLGGQVYSRSGDQLQRKRESHCDNPHGGGKPDIITYKLVVLAFVDLRIEPVKIHSSCGHCQRLDVELITALEEEFDGQVAFILDSGTVSVNGQGTGFINYLLFLWPSCLHHLPVVPGHLQRSWLTILLHLLTG